jgi:hypothetical protein
MTGLSASALPLKTRSALKTFSGYNDTDFIMGVEDMKDHLPSDGKYPVSYIKDLKVEKGIVVVDGSKVGLTDSAGNYLKEKNNVN